MTLDEAKHRAEEALFHTEAGKIPAVVELWRSIDWVEREGDQRAGAESSPENPLEIAVYDPSPTAMIREFGRVLFGKLDAVGQQMWVDKLGVVDDGQAERVQKALREADAENFIQLVRSPSSLLDRYILLNCVNALQANRVSFANARQVILRQYGPTEEYMRGRRYHSMVCILSPYFRRDLFNDLGEALAELAENGVDTLGKLREANRLLHNLIVKLLKRLGNGQEPSKF